MSKLAGGWTKWSGPNILAAVQSAMLEGMDEACGQLLELSQDQVPVDKENLFNSGAFDTELEGNTATGHVFYETQPTTDRQYAVRQHEDLSLHHKPGQKAKYLEGPLADNAKDLVDTMTQPVKDVFK